MTGDDMLRVAVQQSAVDSGCDARDFLSDRHTVVISRPHPEARKYLSLPFLCDLTCYGRGVVASVDERLADAVRAYLTDAPGYRFFETPFIHALEQAVAPFGATLCFMAEYWLPLCPPRGDGAIPYETRLLYAADFDALYASDAWHNALCEKRRELDTLGVGAFDGDRLIGLAACSADCARMWQIGVDVLPAYRGCGVASSLTARLSHEIISRGRVPFYCCAWSNIASARNASRAGFRPAWVQITAIPQKKAAEIIRL